jgi:hypothetical protein
VFGSLLLISGSGRRFKLCGSHLLRRHGTADTFNRTGGLIMTMIIICGTVGSAFFIDKIFVLKNETSPDYYRNVFIIFGIGVALVFPSGIFPEILVGMKKIYLRNYVLIGTKVLELAGIYLSFKFAAAGAGSICRRQPRH